MQSTFHRCWHIHVTCCFPVAVAAVGSSLTCLCRWSGSHIRWGQPFRLRHVTTGKYLSLMEDKSLLLTDKEKADVKSAAFTFRSSKVSQWPTTFPSDAGEWEKKKQVVITKFYCLNLNKSLSLYISICLTEKDCSNILTLILQKDQNRKYVGTWVQENFWLTSKKSISGLFCLSQ